MTKNTDWEKEAFGRAADEVAYLDAIQEVYEKINDGNKSATEALGEAFHKAHAIMDDTKKAEALKEVQVCQNLLQGKSLDYEPPPIPENHSAMSDLVSERSGYAYKEKPPTEK